MKTREQILNKISEESKKLSQTGSAGHGARRYIEALNWVIEEEKAKKNVQ